MGVPKQQQQCLDADVSCALVPQVESSQSMIRIVGLSATLPNYKDVARFLGVNDETGKSYGDLAIMRLKMIRRIVALHGVVMLHAASQSYRNALAMTFSHHSNHTAVAAGLFYFDASYRPVPLEMQFVGVSERNVLARMNIMDEVCYQKVCVCGVVVGG